MEEDDHINFDYDVLNKRIAKAKKDPRYGLDDMDFGDIAKKWTQSFSSLSKPNRRSIADNLNFVEFLKLISNYSHIKTKVGYILYIGKYIVSILGGDGAFCDEATFEVAIIDDMNEFVTNTYDCAADSLQMTLHYQDLVDIDNIITWCLNKSKDISD